ncbi:MAG: 50S ribosome-binding GTPase [Methylobacter sp.]|nr:50S ribosome-binding GTPase [Candidatus Methylobacter titanis]
MNESILSKVQYYFNQEKSLNNDKLLRLENIINNPQTPFRIIVFGKYNHGKSTFLNSWLKQNLFKTGDTRVTTEVQAHKDEENNIIWVDTPGLDANIKDDEVAIYAIKEADIVLLVHDAVAGELDIKELDFIKESSITAKGKIKLLLTKIDQNEVNIFDIMRLIKNQVDDFNIKIFPVSPIRYQKYIDNQSAIWKAKSGFDALYIEIKGSISNRDLLRKQEAKGLCNDLIQQLDTVKSEVLNDIKSFTQQINTKQDVFNIAVQNILKHF